MPAAAARVAVGAYWDGLTLGHVVSGAIAHRVAPARVLRRDAARHGGAADLAGPRRFPTRPRRRVGPWCLRLRLKAARARRISSTALPAYSRGHRTSK